MQSVSIAHFLPSRRAPLLATSLLPAHQGGARRRGAARRAAGWPALCSESGNGRRHMPMPADFSVRALGSHEVHASGPLLPPIRPFPGHALRSSLVRSHQLKSIPAHERHHLHWTVSLAHGPPPLPAQLHA